ncbi:MAG: hypothetical protein E7452_10655 [Ruminococcaceae bacterium]|nr:hypothetical protein [Oscillospiraceae bacterium]
MKQRICSILLLAAVLAGVFLLPAAAIPGFPTIVLQPQSPHYPEGGEAVYSVEVESYDMSCTWYLDYNGVTYNLSDPNASRPWKEHVSVAFGAREDGNVFSYFFDGIGAGLSGSRIWCEITDGVNTVRSQNAYITVQGSAEPPTILYVPYGITVALNEPLDIPCVAAAPEGHQLTYIWYETTTGELPDIKALEDASMYSDYLTCDTSVTGTRYYVCGVQTDEGAMTYSNVIAVTVEEPQAAPPKILTDSLPNAVVGESYSVTLGCTDPNAIFYPYLSPTGPNQMADAGLEITSDGVLFGTPTTPGTYSFAICAMGAANEDYKFYTLVVEEAEVYYPPEITVLSISDATADEPYEFQLTCSEPNAFFYIYTLTGPTDFEKTGLKLSEDGLLSGTPTTPGTYRFTVCAMGARDEAYREFTLTVHAPETTPATNITTPTTTLPTTPAPTTEVTSEATTPATTPATSETTPAPTGETTPAATTVEAVTTPATEPDATQTTPSATEPTEEPKSGLPVWAAPAIGVAAAAAGVGGTLVFLKKRK